MKKLGVVLMLPFFLAACSEKSIEEAMEETTITVGDEQGSFGTNVTRPDWLPKSLALPDELTIQIAAYDTDLGEGMLQGSIPNVPAEDIISSQRAMLEKSGYTVQDAQADGVGATHKNGSYITVQAAPSPMNLITYRMQYFAKHSDDAINAHEKANAYRGNGELKVVLGEETLTLQGSCHVQGRAIQFDSADNSTSLSASAYGATPSVRGTIVIGSDGTMRMFSAMSSGPAGEEPVVKVTATGFTYTGGLVDLLKATTSTGSMTMDCARI